MVSGIACSDSGCRTLTRTEAQKLWDEVQRSKAETDAKLPDERATILAMTEAFHRMRDFGWREAIYCPKDGSVFEAIEAGSSGIHDCFYEGEWPNGRWWILANGDMCPSHPILFRLKPKSGEFHPP